MKTVTIVLTEDEAKELATVLSNKCGMIGWQGVQDNFNGRPISQERRDAMNESWKFWNEIEKKVASSFGYAAWSQPSAYASEEVDMEVARKVLELPLEPTH